jgi:hypothetical protein
MPRENPVKKFIDESGNATLFYYDVLSNDCRNLIASVIDKNGFAPEHDYEYFISHKSSEMKPVFVYFGEHKGLFAIEWDDSCYQVISEILAPENERGILALRFFDLVLKKINAKKVLVEFQPALRKEILQRARRQENCIKIGKVLNHFYTPIIDIQDWNPSLEGSKFSNLRKAKNRFYRNFKVEILHGSDVPAIDIKELEKIVAEWKKNRKSRDRAYSDDYVSFFRSRFAGSACHIALKLNNVLCGISAAWIIPNTNGKNVYYAINLHNYSVPELGDFLTVLFLDELKKLGFEYLDFGSSDENLLNYKKKFGIARQYDTLVYYVKLKKDKEKKDAD